MVGQFWHAYQCLFQEQSGYKSSNEEICEKLAGSKVKDPENGQQESASFLETKSPREDFVSTILESSLRLSTHNMDFIKKLMSKGEMASLFSVVSGLCLMRNRLWYFNQDLQVDGRTKLFQVVIWK